MPITVHRTVRRFEMFLFTLDVCFLLLAVLYLWHKAWLVGISMLVFSFLAGMIGQGLPHRKQQTGEEMASGIPLPISDGRLEIADSRGLGKAAFLTAVIAGLAALIITWHHGSRWYWTILMAIGAYFLILAIAALGCIPKAAPKKINDSVR